MIKVINGKRYNTETAREIMEHSASCPRNDFSWYKESLFVTLKGNYFLAGEGHGNSPYASHYDNSRSYGSKIIPLTEMEALAWCERNATPEIIDEYFDTLVTDA